jgi:hypothetical protein
VSMGPIAARKAAVLDGRISAGLISLSC